MRRPDDPEVNDWLTKVAEDYRVAQLLAESAERLDDAICGLDRRSGRRGQEVEALAGRRRVSAPRVRLTAMKGVSDTPEHESPRREGLSR